MNTQVLGVSVDSKDCLRAWAESLGGISYPLLSDFWPHGGVAIKYGVLRNDGKSERAIFIIDKTGMIRYVDVHDIDTQPDNELLFRELAEIEGVPFPEERFPAPSIEASTPIMEAQPNTAPAEEVAVVMYCTEWCPTCKRARAYFKINNVNFEEINIARDREAAARVRQWSGGYETSPTFDVKGTIIVGFDVEKLSKLLSIPV